jgi:hypothetical protein
MDDRTVTAASLPVWSAPSLKVLPFGATAAGALPAVEETMATDASLGS